VTEDNGNVLREGLQSLADRILRYEITYRKSYMSHIFKKHFFASKCPFLKSMRHEYKIVSKVKKKCERELEKASRGKKLTDRQKQFYMTAFISLPKEKKDLFFQYEAILNKRNSFKLEISPEDKKGNATIEDICFRENYNPVIPSNALFSRELLHEMFKIFLKFMDEFEIKKLDKFEDTTQKVIQYNIQIEKYNESIEDPNKRKTRINETLANQILFNIQHHSLDEMVRLKLISRRTKYNYFKVLEKLGIGKNNFAGQNAELFNIRSFYRYYNDSNNCS